MRQKFLSSTHLSLPLGEVAERSEDGEGIPRLPKPSQSPAATALPEGEPSVFPCLGRPLARRRHAREFILENFQIILQHFHVLCDYIGETSRRNIRKEEIGTDDKTILRGMKREDPAALEAAIRQYGGYVSAVVGNQLGGFAAGEDLEELVSDVFVALWQAAGTLKTEHLRGWLGRVARNQAISFLRRQRLQLISDEDYLLVDDKDAQKLLEAQERSALLTAALDKLTPGDRELFLRRYYYNQTAEQIAREKDMNAGTVRSRLARGRQVLKAELQKGDMQVEDLCAESF